MRSEEAFLVLVLALAISVIANGNAEGDALQALKINVADPNNVLQSWDPTLVNPCTWFHVTCDGTNSVVRMDLGNAGLSGQLVPQLGQLAHLQYLEVYGNNLTGTIPVELANLTKLVSLDLYQNKFTGPIPAEFGNLKSLRFLRLNSNQLSGVLPDKVIQLITHGNLTILDVSDNHFAGTLKATNQTGYVITTVIQDPKAGSSKEKNGTEVGLI